MLALGLLVALGCRTREPSEPTLQGQLELPVHPATALSGALPVPAEPVIATSVPPELPALFPETSPRQHRCSGWCTLQRWLPDPSYALTPQESVPAEAALWLAELDSESRLELPWHEQLELMVLSLSGTLRLDGMLNGDPKAMELRPWSALRASGASVQLTCADAECSALFALVAPGSTLDQVVAREPSRSPALRPHPLEVRRVDEAPRYSWNANENHVRIVFGGNPRSARAAEQAAGPSEPPAPFSLSLLQAAPTVSIPAHTHDHSWEHLWVVQSGGALALRGASHPVRAGDVIHIPRGVRHGYAANGSAPLVAIQLYSPAGPERRFIQAANDTHQRQLSGPKPAGEAKVAP